MPRSHDREAEVYALFDAELRARVRALIDDALIAEHANAPYGPHSDALARVENYFRRAPIASKYIVLAVEPWKDYRIAVLNGARGVAPEILTDSPSFPDERAAAHGVFLRRVRDLLHESGA
jgi:branched-chain amino acid transport system permease protein